MTVLVATPARLTTPRELAQRHEQLVHSLTYAGGMEWRLFYNEQAASFERYEPNATARNMLLERYLRDWHEWVFWLDVDIIELPDDIIQRLITISEAHDGAIVAPLVWMERIHEGPPTFQNGGWFYDTGGFIDANGDHADFEHGIAGNGQVVEMQSVGCVYVVPAWLYRRGLRYRPERGQVEHVSFCKAARELGTKVLATREISVTHAYLPKYGERWHSN